MQEIIDIRLPEDWAQRALGDLGRVLGSGFTRQVKIRRDDPLFIVIRDKLEEARNRGQIIGYAAIVTRKYTAQELEAADLLRLIITAVFEPAGEECGTVYDETTSCPVCGYGRQQTSELILDLARAPAHADIACTIAEERIVSQRLAELLVDRAVSGFELRRVRHVRDPRNGEIAARSCARGRVWHQLIVTSKPVPTVPPTVYGIDPFNESKAPYQCPFGHVSGLRPLSELSVPRAAWDGADMVETKNAVGLRQGLLVPARMLLVSQRLFRLLVNAGIKGFRAEVVHLV